MSFTDDRPRQRELVIDRVFDAPRELVFRMWTDPKHLAKWWGPRDYPASRISADWISALPRSGDTRGISLRMYGLFCSGIVLWGVYGLLSADGPLIAANAITLVLAGFMQEVFLKK